MKNSKYSSMSRIMKSLVLSLLFVASLVIFSCSSNDDEPEFVPLEAARASSLLIVTGDTQIAFINESLPTSIEILVKDQNGNGFAGTTISLSVEEGIVTPNLITTDVTGSAIVNWTLGSSIGEQILTATAFGSDGTALTGSPATVTAEALDLCQTFTKVEQLQIGPDAGTETNSIISITDNFVVAPGVNVALNIEHTWDGDLDIFLIAPDGRITELSSDNGGSGDNYTNTVIDELASALIIDGIAPFTGSFRPEESFALLEGIQATGDWILKIIDDQSSDQGMLLNWSLTLCRP